MVAFILPANSASSGDFITNSLRFEDGDSPHLQLAHGADGTTKTMTFSWWFKQGNITINRNFFGHSSVDDAIFIRSDDGFSFIMRNAADGILTTNRKFRDPSAWYHIVLAIDTTQGTAANRIKLYVNGVQETSFATATYPDQDTDLTGFNTDTDNQFIGRERGGNYFDGYMAEVYFIDGVAKAPTDFGEVNDNGVWVPIEYSGSYGTNGYFLEFKKTGTSQNSSGIGADTSGNDAHFAVTNLAATDVTTDTPMNNFATLRPHGFPQDSKSVISEGNLDFDFTGDGSLGGRALSAHAISNIGVTTGKWYAEFKLTEDADGGFVGVSNMSNKIQTANIDSYNYLYTDNGNKYVREKTGADESNAAHGAAVSVNDIVQVALDATNRNVYFGKGGSWASGSGAWDQSGPTSAVAYTADFVTTDSHDVVVFNVAAAGSSEAPRWQANFGNPPFAISSGNSDADGHGNFEFAVPSGYFALCTKNLAEYG